MYEELIKRLRAVAEGPFDDKCNGCPYEDDFPPCTDCLIRLHKEAADAIEGLSGISEQLPRWISAEERLPEINQTVLVYLKALDGRSFGYSVDYLLSDGQWCKAGHSWRYAVTHWQPLPEPPKEEI